MSTPAMTGNKPDTSDWLVAEFAHLVMEQATQDKGAGLSQILSDFKLALQRQLDAEAARRQESPASAEIVAAVKTVEKNIVALFKTLAARTDVNAALSQQSELIQNLPQQIQAKVKNRFDTVLRQLEDRATHDASNDRVLARLQSEIEELMTGVATVATTVVDCHNRLVDLAERMTPASGDDEEHARMAAPKTSSAVDQAPRKKAAARVNSPAPSPLTTVLSVGAALLVLNGFITGGVVWSVLRLLPPPPPVAQAAPPVNASKRTVAPAKEVVPPAAPPRAAADSTGTATERKQEVAASQTISAPQTYLPRNILETVLQGRLCKSKTIDTCMKEHQVTNLQHEFATDILCNRCAPQMAEARSAIAVAIIQAFAPSESRGPIDGQTGARTVNGVRASKCDANGAQRDAVMRTNALPQNPSDLAALVSELVSHCTPVDH